MVLIWNYISGFFTFVYELLSSVISWIVSIIGIIVSCVSFLGDVVAALPTVLTTSLVALVAIAVIYKVLGREGGT